MILPWIYKSLYKNGVVGDSSDDESEDEEDPDSTEIIHIDSFSFFFQRDSPAQLSDDHLHLQNLENLNENILPQQRFEMVVHNECIINYGPYADDLRTKLMASFLPFMYQHRETTPLIPSVIGEYFNFATLDIALNSMNRGFHYIIIWRLIRIRSS